jgi:glycosyltransferase involved in cell wall biosynthesis
VVTGSRYSKQRLTQSAGVDPDRIEVIPLGIDLNRFRPQAGDDDERLLEDLDLPPRFLVYPANLWPHKNHGRLVAALGATDDPELGLVLTGQDYGRLDDLMQQARTAGVAGRVRHLGYVPAGALPALYRRAAAMAFPSLYEGFGSPPLEAMACGCVVAASSNGSLGEICDGAALSFDPRSVHDIARAIDQVVGDADLRATLREAGLQRAAQFDWLHAASRYTGVYLRAAATF